MKILAALLLLASAVSAAECVPSRLGEKETLARFQELDRAAQSALDAGQYAAGRPAVSGSGLPGSQERARIVRARNCRSRGG